MKFNSNNRQQTIDIGNKLGKLAKANMIFCMSGDLGAGKTTMTKGIAKGLNIDDIITSPTFTIMKSYNGRLPLYHLDCYRLEGLNQDLGFEEYLEDNGLAIIEWSENIKNLINECLYINIEYIDDENRIITLVPNGKQYEQLLKELKDIC